MQSESNVLDPDMEFELSFSGHPLIPELPDDVALLCLLRVPGDNHGACRAVCKRWYSLWATRINFLHGGRSLGLTTHAFLCLRIINALKNSSGRSLTLHAWHTIPL